MALRSTQPHAEMSTRDLPGVKGGSNKPSNALSKHYVTPLRNRGTRRPHFEGRNEARRVDRREEHTAMELTSKCMVMA
jgi:hypothetical protein